MNNADNLRYMRNRALQEQEAARSAICGPARTCHEKMAAEYEARAIQLAMVMHLGSQSATRVSPQL